MGRQIICGIDPGLDGATAVLDSDRCRLLRIDALPAWDYGRSLQLIDDLVAAYGAMQFVIEVQRAMPRQGRSALTGMVRGFGWLHGALMGRGQEVLLLNPQQWQRICGVPMNTGLGKAPAMGTALRSFAELAAMWRDWPMRKKEGVADASLIALAAWRMGEGWKLPGRHHVDLDRMGLLPAKPMKLPGRQRRSIKRFG